MPKRRSRVLEIPQRYRRGLAVIESLSSSSFQEFLDALKRAPQTTTEKELTAWIAPEVKNVSETDISEVIVSLSSLRRVLVRTRELSAEQLAGDVADAMESSETGETSAEPIAPSMVERLTSLLNADSINVLETKAQELKSEFEHSFCDCRIFTDLRPVFGGDVADAPNAMMIVHSLKLGYHDSDENRHRDFHLSLDDSDLRALRTALDRAEAKAESLKSSLESAGIKTLRI